MSNYYPQQQQQQQGPYAPSGPQNLQFYPSSYSPAPGGGAQGGYGYGGAGASANAPGGFTSPGFGGPSVSVSGRMGDQGGLSTGWLAAFSTEGYDGEPALLEELGVDFRLMTEKTLAVLNPFRPINQHIMDDSDIAGPLLFFFLFGTFLLFSGKVHFGYIYGLALLGSSSLHIILSLMSPTESQQQQQEPQHVLGYCLLPLVVTSLIGVVMPMNTLFGHLITSASILWCTYSASGMFCAVGRMRGMRVLVAYPLALFYIGFGLMSIFSSRGVGSPLQASP
uniref:Protein YIP n=1 Tax=Bionectria ochroleuca TaxID=29856 RepID=A0A0B7K6C1_BIOOC